VASPRDEERIRKFSTWLRRKIKDTGFSSQQKFSQASEISNATISRLLNEKQLPVDKTIINKLATILQVSSDEIMIQAGYPVKASGSTDTLRRVGIQENADIDNDTFLSSTPDQNKKPQDLEKILEDHEIWFGKEKLNEQDKEEIRSIVELQLYKRAKELNKRKPKEDKPRD
jgi:transcriptional regulator with XRE-family HTH domain